MLGFSFDTSGIPSWILCQLNDFCVNVSLHFWKQLYSLSVLEVSNSSAASLMTLISFSALEVLFQRIWMWLYFRFFRIPVGKSLYLPMGGGGVCLCMCLSALGWVISIDSVIPVSVSVRRGAPKWLPSLTKKTTWKSSIDI